MSSKVWEDALTHCLTQLVRGVDTYNDLSQTDEWITLTDKEKKQYFEEPFRQNFKDKVNGPFWENNKLTLLTSSGFMGFCAAAAAAAKGEKTVTQEAARKSISIVRGLCLAGGVVPELTVCDGIVPADD